MGISIQDKSVVFSDDFPVLGNIVRNDVLKWGMRPINALSAINLAETTATVKAVNNPVFNSKIGFYRNAANQGYFSAENMDMKDTKKTIFVTFTIPENLSNGQHTIAGSYNYPFVNDYPCGFSAILVVDASGLTLWGMTAGIGSNTTDVSSAWSTLKLSKTTGTFCLAISVDHKNSMIKAHELNINSSIAFENLGNLDFTKYTGTNTKVQDFRFGIGSNETTDTRIDFHECFYFNDVLTDSELQQQKEYSKLILNAKNIDVSSWT